MSSPTLVCTTMDFTDADFVAEPYARLARLRAQGPLLWDEAGGTWLATQHASVGRVLRNRSLGRIWADWEPVTQMEPFNALHRNQMMENEPPEHTRLRRLVAGAFARGHVERMRPRVAAIADRMLDQIADHRTVDILAEYAEPLPVLVIADLLGVPVEDHVMLREWSQAIVHMYEHDVDAATRRAAVDASVAFTEYVREVVSQRKAALDGGHRGEDLLTDLIAARDGEGRLSDDELVASVVLLLNAGHEASVNAFGNGLHALLENPDQLARVVSGEVEIATALEELIRFDTPSQLFERTATADVEVAGQTIAAGERVAALLGSANRDDAVFAQPDRLDVGRDPNPHVGFGVGVHFCLGAPLARMELQISMGELLRRHPGIALAGVAPRRPTFVLRGFERIDVSLRS